MDITSFIEKWTPVVQESLEPLDLSLREFTRLSAICPYRRMRFLRVSEHLISMILNLDWDHRTEDIVYSRVFLQKTIEHAGYLQHCVRSLEVDICQSIQRSEDVCLAVDRYLKAAELLGLCDGRSHEGQQTCHMFLNFLVDNCENTDHAIHVFRKLHKMCNSKSRKITHFFIASTHRCVDYVFKQMQKARYDAFDILLLEGCKLDFVSQPILQCFFAAQYERVLLLLKYGVCMDFGISSVVIDNQWNDELFRTNLWFFNFPTKPTKEFFRLMWRQVLILQIIRYGYTHQRMGMEENCRNCLKMIWRSLPDPYLTDKEILRRGTRPGEMYGICLEPTFDNVTLLNFHNWYTQYIAETEVTCYQPRSLQQYSRCTVRKQLARSFQLPGGVPALEISLDLQRYLRLEW